MVCILMKPGLRVSLVDHALLSCEALWRGWRQTLTFISPRGSSSIPGRDRVCPFASPWELGGVSLGSLRAPCPSHLYTDNPCYHLIALIAEALW